MLGEMNGLRELRLEWNEMGERHIEQLAGALRSLTGLTSRAPFLPLCNVDL